MSDVTTIPAHRASVTQMKNTTSAQMMNSTISLTHSAFHELEFLETVNSFPALHGGVVLQNAIRRYETCWLPLAASVGDTPAIAPPLDVHWVWHCHMLSPYDYELDCQRLVLKVIDHAVYSSAVLQQLRKNGNAIWKTKYPDEPFEYDWNLLTSAQCTSYQPKCTYDLISAVNRQAKFYYQVSLPHYRSETFIRDGLKRYKMFLFLKKCNPGAFLVPCYDIDVIWHTHQLHPFVYKRETIRELGRMLNHDDTVSDRSPDSELSQSYETTRRLWKEFYGEHFASSGAMFRGDSPYRRLAFINPQTAVPLTSFDGKIILQANKYNACILPEHVEQLWGPIALATLPAGEDNDCIAATHRLLNGKEELMFSCRICHSRPLGMSAVQLFLGDQMIVVSHLIGTDQLPTPDMVNWSERHPCINFSEGERAMIIKDTNGDWGIVIGKWKEFRKGIPGIPGTRSSKGTRGVKGYPGYLTVKFFPLRTKLPPTSVKKIPTNLTKFQFDFLEMSVDLKKGLIKFLSNDCAEVAQKTSLVFSISVLYVLCQPRPPVPTGEPLRTVDSAGKQIRHIDSETAAFIVASGYLVNTPCNSYFMMCAFAGSCSGCGVGNAGTCGGCGG